MTGLAKEPHVLQRINRLRVRHEGNSSQGGSGLDTAEQLDEFPEVDPFLVFGRVWNDVRHVAATDRVADLASRIPSAAIAADFFRAASRLDHVSVGVELLAFARTGTGIVWREGNGADD